MAVITINNKKVTVPEGITLIQACEMADVEIPRFCYHERLAIAGNCRMCLVEIEDGPPKPAASCATNAVDGMKIRTNSPMVKKAREGVMEFLLANHPLDCPICDQAGECDLQDQSMAYGQDHSQFGEHKRAVKDKDLGPLVKTTMTRCIHCTRCVRFMDDIAGVHELGAINRGEDMEITGYLEKSLTSELSGNIIDLCPVGALTSKPYAFKARNWELRKTESIDIMDAACSNIRIDCKGLEVLRILPRLNEDINEEWISDKTRFCYDGLKYQRLDQAYIKKSGKFIPVSCQEAYDFIAKKLQSLKGNEIAALSGNLSAVEEILALKLLMQKLGSDNIDCRSAGLNIDIDDRASYTFNTTIAGIEKADSCLLIGVNPRKTSPIINARIRKRYLSAGLKIAAIGLDQGVELTYDYLNLGSKIKVLKDILADKCQYNKILKKSTNPMLIIGTQALCGNGSDLILSYAKKIAEKYNMVSDKWNGFNLLHQDASLVGALDIGFISKNKNVDRDNIIERALRHEIKAIYLLGCDCDDLKKIEDSFIIYQGSHGEKGAHIADVILPGAAYVEKEATYVNTEGRPQITKRAIFPPKDAKEDWKIIYELAKTLKINLGFNDLFSLREIMKKENSIFNNINQIISNDWVKPSVVNDVEEFYENNDITVIDEDFYKTNVIARTSRIMDNCSKLLRNL